MKPPLILRVLLVGKHANGARAIGDLITREELCAPPFTQVECVHAEALEQALAALRNQPPHLVFSDLVLPDSQGLETYLRLHAQANGTPIVVLSEFEDDPAAYQALRLGAQDRLVAGRLDSAVLSRSIRQALARFDCEASAGVAPTAKGTRVSWFEGLASASPRMRELFRICERTATSPATVLIQGETGTGKELVARAIHKRSQRKGRFVALDCGATQDSLIDSELFGHERGAFTGATDRKLGLFRHAHGGTLLLDEIGNLPLVSQHSLLRVLQEGVVRPVGGTTEVPVDVRVIAASSMNLFEATREQRFREDLLYRLDVLCLELPPLRERPEDILHLLLVFLDRLGARYGVEPLELGPGFLEGAIDYPWPGNVRQLENFAERLLLTGSACFSTRDFHECVGPFRSSRPSLPPIPGGLEGPVELSLSDFLAQQEEAYLETLLRETHGSLAVTADRAGVDPRTLRRKLKRYGIERARFS